MSTLEHRERRRQRERVGSRGRLGYMRVSCVAFGSAVAVLLSACGDGQGSDGSTTENPPPSAVNLTVAPASVDEGAGSVSLTVTSTLVGGTSGTATMVTVSVAGDSAGSDDFVPVPSFTVSIAANALSGSASVTFSPMDDLEDEADETVTLSGTASGLSVNPATLTIVDNDEPPGESGWVRGLFMPASTYKDQCLSPRTDTDIDPDTNRPYPDIQGATLDENNWLRSWSNNTYLWYDEIVDRDPGLHDDPLEYFDLLKTEATTPSGASKDRFHFWYDTEFWNALVQSGASAGYGAAWVIIARSRPREAAIAYTDPNTPASRAMLRRGARIVSIDGIDFVNADSAASVDSINAALYPDTAGETHTFEFRDAGSMETHTIELTSEITISTPVQQVRKVTSPSGATVGYMQFNDHILTAEGGLIEAIEYMQSEEDGTVEDLVIDMRYNGGGYLFIASQLAYMIAGPARTSGQTFEDLRFNDKHPETNPVTGRPLRPIPFYNVTVDLRPQGQPLPTLNLSRVFVLSGSNTCSASEAVINALRGVDVEVIQIGERTCGKPYGFYAADNCGTSYFTVQFQGVNAKGFGDYGDGFVPSQGTTGSGAQVPGCRVADDFGHELGDPDEARLAAALRFRDSSTCAETGAGATASGALSFGAHGDRIPHLEPRDGTVHKPEWLTNRILRN